MPCSTLPKPTITPTTRTGHSRAPVSSRRSAADWASLRSWSLARSSPSPTHTSPPGGLPTPSSRRVPRSTSIGRVEKVQAGMAATLLAEALLQAGDLSAALTAAEEAIALCRRSVRGNYEAVAHGVMARALLRRDGRGGPRRRRSRARQRRRADRTHGSEDARARALRVARRARSRARRRRDARAAAARGAARLPGDRRRRATRSGWRRGASSANGVYHSLR